MTGASMWHEDWERAKGHHLAWWQHEGFVISGGWAPKPGQPWEQTRDPGPPATLAQRYTDATWRAQHAHHDERLGEHPLRPRHAPVPFAPEDHVRTAIRRRRAMVLRARSAGFSSSRANSGCTLLHQTGSQRCTSC